MMQPVLRRVVPSSLHASFLAMGQPAAAASMSKLGFTQHSDGLTVEGASSSNSSSSTWSLPSLQLPHLFASREEREQEPQSQLRALSPSRVTATPHGLSSSCLPFRPRLGFAATAATLPQQQQQLRSFASIPGGSSGGLGALAALPPRSHLSAPGVAASRLPSAFANPASAASVRGYVVPDTSYSHMGELLGAAYILVTQMMFWTGLCGAVVMRRNLIIMLACTEVMLFACSMQFVFYASYLDDMTGLLMAITIMTCGASETAIGLAFCVTLYHARSATDIEALNLLK